MSRRLVINLSFFTVLALILCLVGWFAQSEMIKWAAPAFGVAILAAGLGVNSLIIALDTDKKMTEMGAALARIEGLQEEIRKEQNERASSGPPIIASLQAMSQYYMDYINKQKGEDKK